MARPPQAPATCCVAIRASRCGMAALGAAMPLEPAMRAFGARSSHEASRALDELAAKALADCGCFGIDPFGLGLPHGLPEEGLACPGLGFFNPRPAFGLWDGIASARAALALFASRAPDGAVADAWAFEDDWGRCMALGMGPKAKALAARAMALGLRRELLACIPAGGSPDGQPWRL